MRFDARCCLLLVLSLCFPAVANADDPSAGSRPTPQKRKTQQKVLRGKLASKKSEIRDVRGRLKEAKRSEAVIVSELETLKAKLDATRSRLKATKDRLVRARQEQAAARAALERTAKRLRERELQLGRRMAANYRQGPVRYASVLLGSRSMRDMVSRAYVVRTVVRYDARLIAQIKSDRLDVVRWKKQADEKALQVKEQMAELAVRQQEEAQDTIQMRALLAEAKARRAEIENELAELQADSARIAARLKALEVTPLGQIRRRTVFSGSFISPVSGPITSRFGMRYHPILHVTKLHTGVDFGVGHGTPIAAAADGTVVVAGYLKGYGNTVVLDHGGGISTLYAHQSEILCTEGQTVTQGTIIGRVGSTGYSTGPHLHFEVRKDGTPVNPL